MQVISEANYPMYEAIINNQLNHFNITTNREAHFQQGMHAIITALKEYDSHHTDTLQTHLNKHVERALVSENGSRNNSNR